MATVACPSCGLPRAEELLGKVACPVCGHSGEVEPVLATDAEPMDDRPWVIPEPKRVPHASPTPWKNRFLVGFVSGIAAALGGVLTWPAIVELFTKSGTPDAQREDDGPEPTREIAQAPAPREVVTALRIPVQPEMEKPAEAPLPLEPMAVAPRNPFRPDAPRALVLDRAQLYSPLLAPGSIVTVRGHVKTLIVKDLEAGAVLDCSELEAEEVIVVGKIVGGSRLSVRAPGGSVIFRAKVDGGSKVDVRAAGGTVSFETPSGMGRDGSKIDGGSTVELIARSVAFRGQIAGAKTRVSVTLSTGGSLAFAEIDGTARLEYSKLDPDDAEPQVSKGRIGTAAVMVKVD